MKYYVFPYILFIFSSTVFLSSAQSTGELNASEKIFFNGKIFTANTVQPFAEAVAIKNDRIIAVGNLQTVKNRLSDNVMMIDLQGRVLLPGFVDSHNHAIDGGTSLGVPNVFEKLFPVDSLARYAKKIIRTKKGLYGDIIMIDGINITTWSDIPALEKVFNHGFFASHPVMLSGSDGHTAWANYTLLQRAGITHGYTNSLSAEEKKYYGLHPDGEPNGFIAEGALKKLHALLPSAATDYHQSAVKAMEYLNKNGITALLDPAAVRTGKDTSFSSLQAYSWLADNQKLTAHIAALVVADANGDAAGQIKTFKTIQQQYNTKNDLQVTGFKIFADGVIEYPSQTAALSKPYINSGKSAVLLFDTEKFTSFAAAADKAGLLVHVHAIGDRAVTETLNSFEAVRKTNGNRDLPHTITHLQIVLPKDFNRFLQLNVLASFQLLWAFGDVTAVDIVKPYIAPELFRWQYPARSLLQAGALICGASDWPVTAANPFAAIARAETRKGPLGVLDSTQCMPRMAMLYAYTINAAKALMMEKNIGSLEPGKYPDMILVDKDVLTVSPEELAETKVLWTMFKGKIVYRK